VVIGEIARLGGRLEPDPRIFAGGERVAVGWSGYVAGFMESLGAPLPAALVQGPALGGIVNLPAIFIVAVVAGC
jgi:hypothetical protein